MALLPDLVTFRILFPEFASVPDATVIFYLEISIETLNEAFWSDCFNEAIQYYTAHVIALAQNRQKTAGLNPNSTVSTGNTSGAITQVAAGNLSASFAPNINQTDGNANNAWLQRTDYGQHYAALKEKCLPHGYAVLSPANEAFFFPNPIFQINFPGVG